jgi:hypothetical protein
MDYQHGQLHSDRDDQQSAFSHPKYDVFLFFFAGTRKMTRKVIFSFRHSYVFYRITCDTRNRLFFVEVRLLSLHLVRHVTPSLCSNWEPNWQSEKKKSNVQITYGMSFKEFHTTIYTHDITMRRNNFKIIFQKCDTCGTLYGTFCHLINCPTSDLHSDRGNIIS